MRKLAFIIPLCLALVFSSCERIQDEQTVIETTKTIKMPDLSGVDEESAKTSLVNKGLLPIIEYQYTNSNIQKGNVIKTDPSAGSEVEEDARITVYVSLGPKTVVSSDATIQWYHIDANNPDKWEFYAPEIIEGDLYIHCGATFGTSFTLKGTGFGNASLTDSFDKYAPLSLLSNTKKELSENRKVKAGTRFNFHIKVPLSQLDSERPTHIACQIVYIGEDDKEDHINVSFSMSWDK